MARRAKLERVPAPEPDASDEINLGILSEVIGFRFRRIQNHLARTFQERIQQREVRPGLFSALALISANPGLSQTTLAREIGFNEATIVVLLDSLESLKWAERRRAEGDRRRSALYVTKAGEKALGELRDLAVANESKVRRSLTKVEVQRLFDLLDKVYAVCRADDPG
jgi:DNA-binding MarR family transcriptional regulator